MKKLVLLSCAAMVCFVVSCSKDDSTTGNNNNNNNNNNGNTLVCTSVPKTFANDVKAIIQNNCTGGSCHGSGSKNGPGELLTYAQIAAAKANVRSAVSSGSMPKGSSITTAQKNTILCWIDDGAKDN